MALGRGFLSYETPRALPWQKPTSSHRSTAHAPPSSHRSTGHRAPTRPCPHRHGSCRPWLHNSGRWTRRSTSSPRDPNKYRHEGSDTHHDHLRKWMELSLSCDGNRYVRKYRPPPKETEHWGGHAWDFTQQCRASTPVIFRRLKPGGHTEGRHDHQSRHNAGACGNAGRQAKDALTNDALGDVEGHPQSLFAMHVA